VEVTGTYVLVLWKRLSLLRGSVCCLSIPLRDSGSCLPIHFKANVLRTQWYWEILGENMAFPSNLQCELEPAQCKVLLIIKSEWHDWTCRKYKCSESAMNNIYRWCFPLHTKLDSRIKRILNNLLFCKCKWSLIMLHCYLLTFMPTTVLLCK
jgi:hypothetical protein